MDSLPPRSPIKKDEAKGEFVSALPASFFQTSLNFQNDDFSRKRYQTDSFAINFSNSASSPGFDAFAYPATNPTKTASISAADDGKRAQRIRASSLSIPNDMSPFPTVFSSVWTPIKPSAPEMTGFEYADRFAPAVEESDNISAFSRTIGYLGLDDPLASAGAIGDFSSARRGSSLDFNRPRSISVSFPTVSSPISPSNNHGDIAPGFSGRTISSMAIMTEATETKSIAKQPPSPVTNQSWQELTERFQSVTSVPPSSGSTSNNTKQNSPALFDESINTAHASVSSSSTNPNARADFSNSENTVPSRSLWIGNIDIAQTSDELSHLFSKFGVIESIRMLPEKECAFVNFVRLEDALCARDTMQGSRIGNCIVRIGFGKTEALQEVQGGHPTKSLWVGNILPNTKPADLEAMFSKFGAVESARILTHKNCGFVNFVSLRDAIHARQELNGKDIGGTCVKIGFAKVPHKSEPPVTASQALANPSLLAPLIPAAVERLSAWKKPESAALAALPTNAAIESPIISPANQSFESIPDSSLYYNLDHNPLLPIPELCPPRKKSDQARLREFRKKLESHSISNREVEQIFAEILEDADDLCSDYIGNVVIQKLMEKSNDEHRLLLIKKVAPLMAPLGIHKNGTWAIQKIIDLAKRADQMEVIVEALRPFAPALLLDQFGNYVIQCCLRLGPQQNQFIFDAIASKTLEIGQGRFGARATKACLESQYTSKDQLRKISLAIVQNCVQLSMHANGAILLTWLLDGSVLPGRYRVLVPIMIPHLHHLACHKLASTSLLKIVNQRIELDARELLITEIFKEKTLAHIISDHNTGITSITKILSSCCVSVDERSHLINCVRKVLGHGQVRQKPEGSLNYKRLLDELSSSHFIPASASPKESSDSIKDNSRSKVGGGRASTTGLYSKQQQQSLGSPIRSGKVDPNHQGRSHGSLLPTPHQSPSYPDSGSYYYNSKDYI